MWNFPIAFSGVHLVAAAVTPVNDPVVFSDPVRRAPAAILVTLILLAIVSTAFRKSKRFGPALKLVLFALGIGSWVITNSYVLRFGQGIGRQASNATHANGQSSNKAGIFITVILIILIAETVRRYMKESSGTALAVLIVLSGLFFSIGWAQEIALWYSSHAAEGLKLYFHLFTL